MKINSRKHYLVNKADYVSRKKNLIEQKKTYIRKLKESPCVDCGKTYHYCVMDFDHLDSTTKLFTVGKIYSKSWEIIKNELAKCELVCSNCHREREHKRRNFALQRK